MFFAFATLNINDYDQFIKFKSKHGLGQEAQQFIIDFDKYIFKKINQIKKLIQINPQSLQHKDQLKIGYNYQLKRIHLKNIQRKMLICYDNRIFKDEIVLIQIKEHQRFSYKLTINKKQQQYNTETINTAEVAGDVKLQQLDICIYWNSINQQPHMSQDQDIKQLSTPNIIDLNDIQEGFKIISTCWMPFSRLCNIMDDLLHFLQTKQQILIPELNMITIFSFKLMIECNKNFFYLETFNQAILNQQIHIIDYLKLKMKFILIYQIIVKVDKDILKFMEFGVSYKKLERYLL